MIAEHTVRPVGSRPDPRDRSAAAAHGSVGRLPTTEQFPRGYGFLVDQLNRAALSISANIAEGNGRFTKPDRKNFFGIARGSVQECVPLLELARRRQLIDDARHAELKSQLEEISKMLSGLINGLEKRTT
jgi:four helix bundle protein